MISIIISTLNEEHYLPKLLDSIKQQDTTFPFEVLVIDAGSTDNTEGVVKNYQNKVTFPLRFVPFQKGIAKQRNQGARLAQYNQLLFLDADVVLESDFLESSMQQLRKKYTPIAGTKIYAAESSRAFRMAYAFYSDYYLPINRLFNPVIHGCSIFVTKEMHNVIGGFKEGILFEDFRYGQDAAPYFRPTLLKGSAYVRTSARRFYNFSPRLAWELAKGSFQSFFKAGIDPATMTQYEQATGKHLLPRY